jgi:uncharacterized membrane protein YccC
MERRTRQQILAESLYEMAAYLEIKAAFYDAGTDYDEQFNRLVRQQIVVAERQQAARDMVLRGNKTPFDGLLVRVHLRMLELYEYLLSTNTDYRCCARRSAARRCSTRCAGWCAALQGPRGNRLRHHARRPSYSAFDYGPTCARWKARSRSCATTMCRPRR